MLLISRFAVVIVRLKFLAMICRFTCRFCSVGVVGVVCWGSDGGGLFWMWIVAVSRVKGFVIN